MKVIVAGPRHFDDYNKVEEIIENSPFEIDEIVHGDCTGIDALAGDYAEEHMLRETKYPAQWDKYGLAAGPIRNKQMARYADALVALLHDYKTSKGTRNMIQIALEEGLSVYVEHV